MKEIYLLFGYRGKSRANGGLQDLRGVFFSMQQLFDFLEQDYAKPYDDSMMSGTDFISILKINIDTGIEALIYDGYLDTEKGYSLDAIDDLANDYEKVKTKEDVTNRKFYRYHCNKIKLISELFLKLKTDKLE